MLTRYNNTTSGFWWSRPLSSLQDERILTGLLHSAITMESEVWPLGTLPTELPSTGGRPLPWPWPSCMSCPPPGELVTSTWSISLCWDATSSQSCPSALSVLRELLPWGHRHTTWAASASSGLGCSRLLTLKNELQIPCSLLRVADARHGYVDKGSASQPSYQRVTPESNTGLLLPEGNFLAGETEISDVCFVFSDPYCWHVTRVKIWLDSFKLLRSILEMVRETKVGEGEGRTSVFLSKRKI